MAYDGPRVGALGGGTSPTATDQATGGSNRTVADGDAAYVPDQYEITDGDELEILGTLEIG